MLSKKVTENLVWWNGNITLLHLEPTPDGGIIGDVQAQGGWCIPGAWSIPMTIPAENITPECTATTAQEFCNIMAEILKVTPVEVVRAIGGTLEVLKKRKDETTA